MPDYPKEKLIELFRALPQDLKDSASSEDTANIIQEICQNNGITEEEAVSEITKNIGYSFLGLLPPVDLAYVLEKEIGLKKSSAETTAAEIIRYIFLPVRPSMEALYKTELSTSIKPGTAGAVFKKTESKTSSETPKIQKDKYREPIDPIE
jgi:hypothetical protein